MSCHRKISESEVRNRNSGLCAHDVLLPKLDLIIMLLSLMDDSYFAVKAT